MLLKFMRPFKLEEKDHLHHGDDKPSRSSPSSSCNKTSSHESRFNKSTDIAAGLRIVEQISSSGGQNNSNVVVKSALRLRQTRINNSAFDQFSCFPKTCNLCNKGLSLDKEVYMYRGDQGFCSIECRDRQINLDEMRELEDSTKQMIASYRSSCNINPARRETRVLLEDLHRQRHHKPIPNHREIAQFVIS